MKSNSIVSVTENRATREITFVALGEGGGSVTLHLDRAFAANAGLADELMYHGAGQKVRDAAAIQRMVVRDKATGAAVETKATPRERLRRMTATIEALHNGTWRVVSQERIGADETLLSRALQELYLNKTNSKGEVMNVDWIRAKVTGMTAAERKAMLAQDPVKAVADRLKAEDVADVDVVELMEDFA